MLKIGIEIETSLTSPWLIGQLAPKLQLLGSGKLNVIGTPKMTPKTLLVNFVVSTAFKVQN